MHPASSQVARKGCLCGSGRRGRWALVEGVYGRGRAGAVGGLGEGLAGAWPPGHWGQGCPLQGSGSQGLRSLPSVPEGLLRAILALVSSNRAGQGITPEAPVGPLAGAPWARSSFLP